MGLEFPVSATCDKCSRKTVFKMTIAKLQPNAAMYVKMPNGWTVSSKPESGDVLITCPSCAPVLVSIPPVAIDEADLVSDPATNPTMPALPSSPALRPSKVPK